MPRFSRSTAPRSQKANAERRLSPWRFYFRNDADSVAPNIGALLAASILLGVGALLPVGLVLTGEAHFSPWLLAGAGFATLVAACVPKRLVFTDHGVMLLLVFGRNRRLEQPGEARWWGRYVPWKDVVSVTLKKNNYRRPFRLRFGEHRYVLRLRWHGTHEVHEAEPAFGRFERLARQHIPERIQDVSTRWWSVFQ